MPVTFRAPEPVRFDVDPPEDWEPSLRSQEEVDALFWDQLLNSGKRGVNWLADQLFGRTAEEEFETAMVEFANPLISLVPRKTLKELLRRSSRTGETGLVRLGGKKNLDEFPQGQLDEVYDDEFVEHSPDVRRAAEWVAERYPRTQSHMEEILYSPVEFNPQGRGGSGLAAYFHPNTRSLKVNPELSQTASPPFKNIWVRTDPPRLNASEDIPADEIVDHVTHELTHSGQQLRGMSRANTRNPGSGKLWDLLDSHPDVVVPSTHASSEIRRMDDYISYLEQPIERSARLSGAKNRLNYLREASLEIGDLYQGKYQSGSVRAEAKRANLTLQRLARDYWDGVDDAVKARFEHPDAPAFDLWFNTEFKPALNGGGARWQRLAREMAQDISDQPLNVARAERNTPDMRQLADDAERAYEERELKRLRDPIGINP